MQTLTRKTLVLGVTGSIAAYKALLLTRLLREAGAEVWPILSRGACRFVTPLSFATLAGRRPITDLWSAAEGGEVGHVELAHRADLILIAPASANALSRLAQGTADDPLSALALASRAPTVVAPAMESGMWEHPATQEHVRILQERGVVVVPPGEGYLASGRSGVGRMTEPERLLEAAATALTGQDFVGQHVLVTAGPTREAFDPARFISNPSTGKMGFALARAARRRGATVHLIHGPTLLPPPADMACTAVTSTEQMLEACREQLPPSTVLIMAAAPADYRPETYQPSKLKKQSGGTTLTVTLTSTPDVLLSLQARRPGRLVVGFAAETDALLPHAQDKLMRKDLDLLVANPIGAPDSGFGSDTNHGWLLRRDAPPLTLAMATKQVMADVILDHVAQAIRGAGNAA